MGRCVRGCAAHIGCFFGLSGLQWPLFYLKIKDIGRVYPDQFGIFALGYLIHNL